MSVNPKIKTLKELAAITAKVKKGGKKVALCHGVFDLMHVGHIRSTILGDSLARTLRLLGHRAALAGPGRHGQPVHDRVGDPDRRARDDGHGQAVKQPRGHVLGTGHGGQLDPGHGDLRAQLVDVHGGHAGPGRAQQPVGQLVRAWPGTRVVGEPVAVLAEQPDRQVSAAGVETCRSGCSARTMT